MNFINFSGNNELISNPTHHIGIPGLQLIAPRTQQHKFWWSFLGLVKMCQFSYTHCFYKHQNSDLSKWRVKIGQRSSHSWINIRRVASLTVHPLFQAQSFDFDLSLILDGTISIITLHM